MAISPPDLDSGQLVPHLTKLQSRQGLFREGGKPILTVAFPTHWGSLVIRPLPHFRARMGMDGKTKKGHRWREVSRKRWERREGEVGEEKSEDCGKRENRWREKYEGRQQERWCSEEEQKGL